MLSEGHSPSGEGQTAYRIMVAPIISYHIFSSSNRPKFYLNPVSQFLLQMAKLLLLFFHIKPLILLHLTRLKRVYKCKGPCLLRLRPYNPNYIILVTAVMPALQEVGTG